MKNHKMLKKVAETSVKRNVNSACVFWLYQLEIPTTCKKLKKMK